MDKRLESVGSSADCLDAPIKFDAGSRLKSEELGINMALKFLGCVPQSTKLVIFKVEIQEFRVLSYKLHSELAILVSTLYSKMCGSQILVMRHSVNGKPSNIAA